MTSPARVLTVLVALGLGLLVVPAAARSADPHSPTRIMVVGDSISHGSSGDYTWRWFLDRNLRGTPVDLVGPRQAPYALDPVDPNLPGTYQDPHFDTDHASLWGDSFALGAERQLEYVAEFQPDVVVLELGANDLTFLQMTPQQVVARAKQWIVEARALRPGVSVVLCDVPVVDRAAVRAYNEELPELVGELDAPSERVVLAPLSTGYVMGSDPEPGETTDGYTWDQAHPNTVGQQHIAAAVTDALAVIGVGSPVHRPLPAVKEPAGVWVAPQVAAGESDATVTWQRPAGATSVDVWYRQGEEDALRAVKGHTGQEGVLSPLAPCQPVQVVLRSRKGWTLSDEQYASPPVTAMPGPRVTESPLARAWPSTGSVWLTWDPVPGVCRTLVHWTWTTPSGEVGVRTDELLPWATWHNLDGVPDGSTVSAQVVLLGGQESGTSTTVTTVVPGGAPSEPPTVSPTRPPSVTPRHPVTVRQLYMARPRVTRPSARQAVARWKAPRQARKVEVSVRRGGGGWSRPVTRAAGQGQYRLAVRRSVTVKVRVRAKAGKVRGRWSSVTTSRAR